MVFSNETVPLDLGNLVACVWGKLPVYAELVSIGVHGPAAFASGGLLQGAVTFFAESLEQLRFGTRGHTAELAKALHAVIALLR